MFLWIIQVPKIKNTPSESIHSFLARAAIGILFFTNLFQEQKCVMSFKHKARKGMYLKRRSPQKSALNSSRLTSTLEQHNGVKEKRFKSRIEEPFGSSEI